MARPSSGARARPQTAGSRPRSANVQAFQRGKDAAQVEAMELCQQSLEYVSSQLLTNFQSELQKLSAHLEHQVVEAIEHHQQKAEEKLDSIFKAQTQSWRPRSESPKRNYFAGLAHDGGQIEANRQLVRRRDEQIKNMLVLLEKLDERCAGLEGLQRLEMQMAQSSEKLDLIERSVQLALEKEPQAESPVVSMSPRSWRLERSDSQQFLTKNEMVQMQQQLMNEADHDLDHIYSEIKASRKLANHNFRTLIKELSRIQQALNLDFAVASESEDSDDVDSAGGTASVHVTVRKASTVAVAVPLEPFSPSSSTAVSVAAAAASAPLPLSPDPAAERAASAPMSERSRSIRLPGDEPEGNSRRPSRANSRDRDPASEAPRDALTKRFKRVREFWTQTQVELEERGAQTEPMRPAKKKEAGFGSLFGKKDKTPASSRGLNVNDLDSMKARARKALMRPQYDVTNFYKTEGCFQAIARSNLFDQLTVTVVCLNAVWIAIDTDNNTALFLTQAEPVFIIVENLFCTYFFLEVCIRFGAFERKRRAFMDKWFVFDAILVLNMVVETWLLPILILTSSSDDLGNTIDVSMLRMLRLVKLTRLSRITRLLRAVPELAIIVKAIGLSARSVTVFFALWLVLIYVFAITLRQLTSGTDFGQSYFSSVPDAMDTLLLDGILADYAPLAHAVPNGHPIEWILIIFFVLLASITIMYMLVGVLVEVVGALAHAEKESITVGFIASSLRKKMEQAGHDEESVLSKSELQDILLDPEITEVLQSVQVDLVALTELVNIGYEDAEKTGATMTFEKIVGLVLNGRGQNTACVKDTSELLRILKQIIIQRTSEVSEKLQDEIAMVHRSIQSMREEQMEGVSAFSRFEDEESPPEEDVKAKKTARGRQTRR